MWPSRAKARFESLVRAYSADLYRFAYWLARDRAIAEDLVQECFARAWKHFDQLVDDGAAKHWLFAIARNEHARLYAKPRPEQDATPLEQMEEMPDTMISLPARLDLHAALHHLPDGHREPLLLQVLGGFSCAEIGAMLSLSEANVMQRVSRARRALRNVLEPDTTLRENIL
jgi:RNA polymerase sigma-70 factor (ECF subfamily)